MILTFVKQEPAGYPYPNTLDYETVDEKLIITYKSYDENNEVKEEIIDELDFSDFPDGEADVWSIETSLPVKPAIVSAKRENGILTVTVLDWAI